MSCVRKTFAAKTENIPIIMDFIWSKLSAFSDKTQYDVALATEEVVSNIVSYAYPPDQIGEISLEFHHAQESGEIHLTFIDWGIPFNPLELAEPDFETPMMSREMGGLGVWLIRKICDQVEYTSIDGKNVLKIKKVCEQIDSSQQSACR